MSSIALSWKSQTFLSHFNSSFVLADDDDDDDGVGGKCLLTYSSTSSCNCLF